MKSKRALITGVTGQDGSWLAELLLDKGYVVVGITRRTSGDSTQRVRHLVGNANFELVEGDVTDYGNILGILSRYMPHEIYNLAAQSHVATSFKQPKLTWDVVAVGCMNVLNALVYLQDEVYKPRFYQASSSEMFGDQYNTGEFFVDEPLYELGTPGVHSYVKVPMGSMFQDEGTTMNPQSPYSVAKLAAHHMTRLYRECYGLFAVSGILFNHDGERRGEKFVTRKVSKYVGNLMKWRDKHNVQEESIVNSKDEIYLAGRTSIEQDFQFPKLKLGNLSACRDWGHAEDYVRGMHLMLQQEKPEDFVLATGKTHTVEDFVIEAFKYAGIDNYEDYVLVDDKLKRPAEVPFLKGRATKAKEVLGWEPEIDFKTLVGRMVTHDYLH